MLNILWAAMILIGVLWGAFHGTLDAVTQGAIDSAKEAVTLSITMLGVMTLWSGILEVGRSAGLIGQLSKKMRPVMRFLFPNLKEDGEAARQICVNLIANLLGLGWAATPAGLNAMKELKKLSPEPEDTASREMCTFLIINISSLQLIPMNMIAYRSQYGSPDPAAIIVPSMAATLCSTLAGVAACKVLGGGKR